jgi:DNA-binding PadR family transcriptional regulator
MFGQFRESCREHEHGRHRHRHGGFDEDWEGMRRGFGGGRERLFDNGHLRLLILQLIADKPSYGYEIIKAIEERLAGGYAPSPGVVYPTLTLLEEEGLAVSSTEGNKKRYTATEEGRAQLREKQVLLKAMMGRMEQAAKMFGRGRSPQIERAVMNLRLALKMRMGRGDLDTEKLKAIALIIDGAARSIDEA